MQAVARPIPRTLRTSLGDVPLPPWLREAGLGGASPLAGLTFGALFAVRRLGPRGILDFAIEAERTADDARRRNGWPHELGELRSRISAAPWANLVTREDPRFADLFS